MSPSGGHERSPNPEFEIEKLRREHSLSQFDCGNATLNAWLHKYAWSNQQADSAKTYVALAEIMSSATML